MKAFMFFGSWGGISLSVLAIAAGLVNPVIAGEGNGGGHNGPVMEGRSIPVELDRAVDANELLAVVGTCLGLGDLKRGLVPISHRVYAAIYGRLPAEPEWWDFAKLDGSWDQERYGETWMRDVYTASLKQYASGNIFTGLKFNYVNFGHNGTLKIRFTPPGDSEFSSQVEFESVVMFPQLKAGELVEDHIYDQWGRILRKRWLAKDVFIMVPEDAVLNRPYVEFTNKNTNRKIRLPISFREYADCLNSELQRGSRE